MLLSWVISRWLVRKIGLRGCHGNRVAIAKNSNISKAIYGSSWPPHLVYIKRTAVVRTLSLHMQTSAKESSFSVLCVGIAFQHLPANDLLRRVHCYVVSFRNICRDTIASAASTGGFCIARGFSTEAPIAGGVSTAAPFPGEVCTAVPVRACPTLSMPAAGQGWVRAFDCLLVTRPVTSALRSGKLATWLYLQRRQGRTSQALLPAAVLYYSSWKTMYF